jgi:NitT/TauT family transport system substrate-binding protein
MRRHAPFFILRASDFFDAQRGWLVSGGNGRRRDFLRAAASTLAVPSLCMAAAEPWRNPQRVTLALAARQSLYHLPLTLAEQLGFFRQAGIQIEWSVHESGAKALASAVQGQADVVAAAFDHLLGLQHRGLNFQAFVLTGRTPQLSLGVASRRDLPSMLALKGARFGVTSIDSSTYWLTCQWLLQNGLLPEDVVFVEVGTSALAVEALRSGAIDALCQPDPVMYGLEQRNEVRVVGDARTLMGTRKLMGGAVPGGCLLARTDFLQRQPDIVQALSDAVVHALKWLQTAGLTDILKTVPTAHWSGDRAHYLGAFEKLRESYALDGLIASDAVLSAWHAHARLPARLLGPRQGLALTYTNTFALKSKSRFSA